MTKGSQVPNRQWGSLISSKASQESSLSTLSFSDRPSRSISETSSSLDDSNELTSEMNGMESSLAVTPASFPHVFSCLSVTKLLSILDESFNSVTLSLRSFLDSKASFSSALISCSTPSKKESKSSMNSSSRALKLETLPLPPVLSCLQECDELSLLSPVSDVSMASLFSVTLLAS